MNKKLPLYQRLAYASTDTAGNLLYCIISGYLLYFYTDVFGLSVGVAGTILLCTRFLDAFDAPIWGFIIDHTKSKYGKSRPYFLWLSIPFALATVLTFTTPNLTGSAKIAWAVITYITAGVLYSGISTPITSILPNLSSDADERIVLNSYRMTGGNVGYFLAVTFILPMVGILGRGNDRAGFTRAVAIFAVIGVILFLFAFTCLREENAQEEKSISIKKSIGAIKGNWPWVIIVGANLFYWLANTVRTSSLVYYFQYNLDRKDLVPVINGLSLIQVLGVVLIPFITKKFKKCTTMIFGLALASTGHVIMGIAGPAIPLLVAGWLIACVGTGIAVSMPFAMLSDAVDYGEWKTGIRASGFLTAIGSAFCIKAGSGLGGFIPSLIMNAFGYTPNQQQTASSLMAIKFNFIWLPILMFLGGAVVMFFYRRHEANEMTIKMELAQRR